MMSSFLALLVRLYRSGSLEDSSKDSDFKIQTVYPCSLQKVLSTLLKVKVSNSNTSLSNQIHQIICHVLELPYDKNPFVNFLMFRNVKPFGMI